MKMGLNDSSVVRGLQTGNIGMTNISNKGSINTNASAKNSAAVIFSRSSFRPNVSNDTLKDFSNDLTRIKLSLRNNSDSNADSKLLDEFLTKYNEYKEKGLFDGQTDDNNTNQIFQNSVLDLVDEFRAKAVNEEAQNYFKEMKARGDMGMFLVRALGITSGHVDWSDKGISRMMELYEEKLKDGTLNSDNAEILDLDAFNKYREKNSKDTEEAIKEREAYSLLLKKLDAFKNSLVQYFEGK
ncbi:hypothetical protein [Lysinibacillus sp. NPDC047702]|uniref:hypothetical protein n=1 Tax=unclassified Lysinibacillus TaxID=2636778 RepID=UPI003D036B0E